MTRRPRIAVAFFGIARSLSTTRDSIERNVLDAARTVGTVRTFSHLYDVGAVVNSRSGEDGSVPSDPPSLLGTDESIVDDPRSEGLDASVPFRRDAYDPYGDDWRSVRNLLHQLHSLRRVTQSVLAWQPDVVCFCRPDLAYHDDLRDFVVEASTDGPPTVWLPSWQSFCGYNDRFSVVRGRAAIEAYGDRIAVVDAYRTRWNEELQAESLLRFALRDIDVRFIATRATRVRSGGRFEEESFRGDRRLEATIDRLAPFDTTTFRVRNRWAWLLTLASRDHA